MNKYLRKTLTIFIFIGVLFLLAGCRKGDTGARPIEGFTGFFDIFVYPMAGLMWLVGQACLGNYALAILFTTIIVRTLAWPIYAKTTDLSLKMQLAQPEIDKINQKYQAIGASKDPQTRQMSNKWKISDFVLTGLLAAVHAAVALACCHR